VVDFIFLASFLQYSINCGAVVKVSVLCDPQDTGSNPAGVSCVDALGKFLTTSA